MHRAHQEKHFEASSALRDLVLGVSDGLTVPFALAAGLSGALESNALVLTAGIAEIAAGAISMGLGGYLAGRTEIEYYQSELTRERREIDELPDEERREVRSVLEGFGLDQTLTDKVTDAITSDPKRWLDFMMKFELGLEKPKGNRPSASAIRIGTSYAIGGFVPLCAYMLTDTPKQGLILSSILTITALGLFGFLKAQFTEQPRFKETLYTVGIGVSAAGAAYWITSLLAG